MTADLKRLRAETDAAMPDAFSRYRALAAERAAVDAELNRLRAALRLAHSGIRVYRQSTPCSSDHRPGDLYEECRGCGFHVILETAQAALRAGLERLCSNPVCTAPVAAGASRCTACARAGRGEEASDAHD